MFLQTKFENKLCSCKQYQESLSPDKKAQVLVKHVAEQQNYRQSLSPEKKFK
jgi:hypothetical protein